MEEINKQIGFAVTEEGNLHIVFEGSGFQAIVPKDDIAGLIGFLHKAYPEHSSTGGTQEQSYVI